MNLFEGEQADIGPHVGHRGVGLCLQAQLDAICGFQEVAHLDRIGHLDTRTFGPMNLRHAITDGYHPIKVTQQRG